MREDTSTVGLPEAAAVRLPSAMWAARDERLVQELAHWCGHDTSQRNSSNWDYLSSIASYLGLRANAETGELSGGGAPSKPAKRSRPDSGLCPGQSEHGHASEGDGNALLALETFADNDNEEADDAAPPGLPACVPVQCTTLSGVQEAYHEHFRLEEVVCPDDFCALAYDQVTLKTGDRSVLQWLLAPVDVSHFLVDVVDRHPLLVSRPSHRSYYDGTFSTSEVWELLARKALRYSHNVDVTRFSAAQQRENFNYNVEEPPELADEGLPAVADAAVVRRRFESDGCSVRLLHPQRFSSALWQLLAPLEGVLNCAVGCNVYLTPAGCQGFAPHFDDVDVIVLQIEGCKAWTLYSPMDSQELARNSSRDLTHAEVGEPLAQVVLRPGDCLYLPRGAIHEAQSLPDTHSMHLTVSANQRQTYFDWLSNTLQMQLRRFERACLPARATLPMQFTTCMGVMYSEDGSNSAAADGATDGDGNVDGRTGKCSSGKMPALEVHGKPLASGRSNGSSVTNQLAFGSSLSRRELLTAARALLSCFLRELPWDDAADELALQVLNQRLPPVGLPARPSPPVNSLPEHHRLVLAAPGLARLVSATEDGSVGVNGSDACGEDVDENDGEDGGVVCMVHHCMNNAREMHASALESGKGGNGDESSESGAGESPSDEGSPEMLNDTSFGVDGELVGIVEAVLKASSGEDVMDRVEKMLECMEHLQEEATELLVLLVNLGIVVPQVS